MNDLRYASANPANVRQSSNGGHKQLTSMARPPASANAGRGYGGYIGRKIFGQIGGPGTSANVRLLRQNADFDLSFLAVLSLSAPPRFPRFGDSGKTGRAWP